MPEHLTKQTFREKVFDYENNEDWKFEGELPAVIDFYADWCQPCKMIAPILEDLADEYEDEVDIYKVDTGQEQELAAAFGIRSIPTLLFILKDVKPQMAKGALPKKEFQRVFKEVLKV